MKNEPLKLVSNTIPLPPNTNSTNRMREELLHLLSVSATLSGVCITVVALMHTFGKRVEAATIVDDMFAICTLLFLVCMSLIFSAVRVRDEVLVAKLVKLIDGIFLVSMTCMTLAGFVMVYTVW